MISSTARDLPEHRREIHEGCERAGFEPHMMEMLPALDADAIKASLRMVEEADVYVGVFAFRYGYVPKGYDISITEMEYNRAVELKRPRLVFFIHDDHPITKKDVETGPGEAKLQALKDRIGKERVVTFFRSPKDLRAQVVEALTALGKKLDAADAGDAAAAVVSLRPTVPAQRSAAIDPVWKKGRLTVPKAPAKTDLSKRSFAAALLALRQELREFTDQIANENIDRRFVCSRSCRSSP